MRSYAILCLLLLLSLPLLVAEPAVDTSIWRNPDRPIPERVAALRAQLTQREKIALLYWLAPAIERLGIPAYHIGNESLHGLIRPGKRTVFPQAIGLAATFDPVLVGRMASAISDEARATWNENGGKHLGLYSDVLTCWSPVVNMARDPRWGRTQETYGEDPLLTSRMGVAFVRGLQGKDAQYIKVIATPKHFAGNNQEEGRFGKNIVCDERYLFDYELRPFRACVMEGRAQSIMASYTAINGIPSVGNRWLLMEVLRQQWGFDGFVVSDCGAISNLVDKHHFVASPEEAIAATLNAGLDVEGGYFSTYPDVTNKYLQKAIDRGLISQKVVDQAVSRLLTARFRLGMYDPPERVPYAHIPISVVNSDAHRDLARRLAVESMVLLKNEPQAGTPLLPLDPTRIKHLVVVGPNADIENFGDYSGIPAVSTTALAGIRARAARAGMEVTAIPWSSGDLVIVPSDALSPATGTGAGLTGTYYATGDFSGTPQAVRVDRSLAFDWAHTQPDPLAAGEVFSVRWTGTITTRVAGEHRLTIYADGGVRVLVDGHELINRQASLKAGRRVLTAPCELPVGAHQIVIEYSHCGMETGLFFKWAPPADLERHLQTLAAADAVVAIMGLSTHDEDEGRDRTTLRLPASQEALLEKMAAANPRLVVVTESGSPLVMPWAARVPAILHGWYPGQEGGDALADLLWGDAVPAGRLPLTFYAADAQVPPMEDYDLTKGRTYLYLRDRPAWAFGHGLSYTTFRYGPATLSTATARAGENLTATLTVTNTGTRDADEVVQAYVTVPSQDQPRPLRQLWGFQRVPVAAKSTVTVQIPLRVDDLGFWAPERRAYVVAPGTYRVQIGAASDDLRTAVDLAIKP